MKKIVCGMIVLCGMTLLLSGCGKETAQTMTCTLTQKDVVNQYELDATYVVNYKNDLVTDVETTEIVTSDDTTVLDSFEQQLKQIYQAMQDSYGGYDINIQNDGQKVTSIVKIDYQKLNFDQLIEDNSAMKNYVNDKNQLTLDGIKTMYQSQGISCE